MSIARKPWMTRPQRRVYIDKDGFLVPFRPEDLIDPFDIELGLADPAAYDPDGDAHMQHSRGGYMGTWPSHAFGDTKPRSGHPMRGPAHDSGVHLFLISCESKCEMKYPIASGRMDLRQYKRTREWEAGASGTTLVGGVDARVESWDKHGEVMYAAQKEDFELCKARCRDVSDYEDEISSEVIESASIWDQQCFLVENMKLLAMVGEAQSYENFGMMADPPGAIVSAIHRGEEKDTGVETMLNLTSAQYAYLVPYMKLYRVLYSKEKGQERKIIGEQELPIESFTGREDIERMLSSQRGRLAGSGLKSFRWKLEGVQPEEIDNNITATLEMHFQSIQDLFRYNMSREDPEEALRAQAGQVEPGFLDLIIAPETAVHVRGSEDAIPSAEKCKLEEGNTLTYDGASYRIKVDVGWAIPPEPPGGHPGLLGDIGELKKAIESQRKSLFLQLARHNITFQQDGVVKLTVEYQAALNGMLRSPSSDILAHPNILKDIFEKGPHAARASELRKQNNSKEGLDVDSKEWKELKGYLDEQIKLEQEDRLMKYRRLLTKVYDNGKISSIRVKISELSEEPWRNLTPAQRDAKAKKRQKPTASGRGFTIHPNGVSGGTKAKDLLKNIKKLDKKEIERVGKGLNSIREATPNDYVDIHYFYLGDLIDSILELEQFKDAIEARNYQVMLGTLDFIDPLTAYQIGNIAQIKTCGAERDIQKSIILDKLDPIGRNRGNDRTIVEHMPLASIPIGVDAFNQWFYNKVIKKGLTKYYFDQFIRDMLASLIGRSLSSRCFPDIPQIPLRFATNDFYLGGGTINGEKHKLLGENGIRKRVTKKLQIPNIDRLGGGASGVEIAGQLATLPKPLESTPTLFVYSTDARPAGLAKGNRLEDLDLGIYHFYLGANAGLIKKIDFQREDMPYFREAKIHKTGALGATQLRELYKVKMTMVGNTLLKNGQYVYINPTAIGAGSTQSRAPNLAKMLGLGGYFLVTGVSHQITEGGFEVVVEALHQAVREGGGKSIPIVPVSSTAESSPSVRKRSKKKPKERRRDDQERADEGDTYEYAGRAARHARRKARAEAADAAATERQSDSDNRFAAAESIEELGALGNIATTECNRLAAASIQRQCHDKVEQALMERSDELGAEYWEQHNNEPCFGETPCHTELTYNNAIAMYPDFTSDQTYDFLDCVNSPGKSENYCADVARGINPWGHPRRPATIAGEEVWVDPHPDYHDSHGHPEGSN